MPLLILGAACTSSASPSPSTTGPVIPGTRLPASPTALPTYTYDQFHTLLTQLKGTPVLVNIWATWCGPCKDEAPQLSTLAKDYAGKVQFVGVDILDTASAARSWVQTYGWSYPSVSDPTKAIENGLGYIGQPITIVYDASGAKVLSVAGSFVATGQEPKLRSTLESVSA
jgi:cytochrome c biogenesis protein CcmG, thiol:disulfide interchange protein DsbE